MYNPDVLRVGYMYGLFVYVSPLQFVTSVIDDKTTTHPPPPHVIKPCITLTQFNINKPVIIYPLSFLI